LQVYGPEQSRVSYLIFVRDEPAEAWQRVDVKRRGFPQGSAGHDIGPHGVRRARQVMIRNVANHDLSLDAVTAGYKDTIASEPKRHIHN
jgi:hypothetical protein